MTSAVVVRQRLCSRRGAGKGLGGASKSTVARWIAGSRAGRVTRQASAGRINNGSLWFEPRYGNGALPGPACAFPALPDTEDRWFLCGQPELRCAREAINQRPTRLLAAPLRCGVRCSLDHGSAEHNRSVICAWTDGHSDALGGCGPWQHEWQYEQHHACSSDDLIAYFFGGQFITTVMGAPPSASSGMV